MRKKSNETKPIEHAFHALNNIFFMQHPSVEDILRSLGYHTEADAIKAANKHALLAFPNMDSWSKERP